MKNIDYVIQKTAAELNLPVDQVKMVIMEYWKTGFQRLVKLETTTISMRHVGNFTVSKWKLNNYLRKKIKIIRGMKVDPKLTEEKRQELLDYYNDKLRVALVQRNILAIHYKKMFALEKERKAQKKLKNEQSKRLVDSSKERS